MEESMPKARMDIVIDIHLKRMLEAESKMTGMSYSKIVEKRLKMSYNLCKHLTKRKNKDILHYAKRLGDYVRMEIENRDISSDHPLYIAYTDFIKEWKIYQKQLIK